MTAVIAVAAVIAVVVFLCGVHTYIRGQDRSLCLMYLDGWWRGTGKNVLHAGITGLSGGSQTRISRLCSAGDGDRK